MLQTSRSSCGLAAKAAPLQGDERWFESTQDDLGGIRVAKPGLGTGLLPAIVSARPLRYLLAEQSGVLATLSRWRTTLRAVPGFKSHRGGF